MVLAFTYLPVKDFKCPLKYSPRICMQNFSLSFLNLHLYCVSLVFFHVLSIPLLLPVLILTCPFEDSFPWPSLLYIVLTGKFAQDATTFP